MQPKRHILKGTPIKSGQLRWRRDLPMEETMTKKAGLWAMGMALDEMILAGAMVSSVGLFAAVSVPWDTVLQTDNTRLVNELTSIEQANTNFYLQHHRWPYQMTDGSSTHNAAALVTKMALRYPYNTVETYQSTLKDVPFDVRGNRVSLRHSFGPGGRIVQEVSDNPAYVLKVTFENMPLDKVKELDVKMDKTADLDNGRVRADVHNGQVDMVFYANPVATAQK